MTLEHPAHSFQPPRRPAPRPVRRAAASVAAVAAALLAGCAAPPAHTPPALLPMPAAFKEAGASWAPAAPADTLERGPWWELFGDPDLNRLAQQVQVSNQNIAAAVAAYAQAQAVVRQQRAGLFPAVSVSGSATRAGGDGSTRPGTTTQAALGVDWAPDLWGRLQGAVDGARASAQASEADLASARLSALGALASAYFQLREADAETELLQATVEGYDRSLTIARNRYAAGVVAQTDVLQAQTQLANARADLATVRQTRARLEHAVAVLTGRAPADFSLPPGPWVARVPEVPVGVPSGLLQRRPDIAAAERAVAAANAQIGIQRAAFFPNLSLGASLGTGGTSVGDLFKASNLVWSLGVSVAQTLFDAGARAARVDEAQAAWEARVAVYRQTVLTAFQGVEDQLTGLRTLQEQEPLRREAVAAAQRTAEQLLNRYREGQVGYTEVVTAQVSLLSAQRALLQLQVNRQLAAVALVQALGGGWQAPWPSPA
ncbi:efflux transporter outer membrane subunit [Paracidovorax sp. MALMAid1276]|uniref:efflux transporter outer membrane subunit n=1 Tax=Paracidovorax sp. MALMAid1276 TaxID=3411631 RepID=UPI003B99D654